MRADWVRGTSEPPANVLIWASNHRLYLGLSGETPFHTRPFGSRSGALAPFLGLNKKICGRFEVPIRVESESSTMVLTNVTTFGVTVGGYCIGG